MAAIRDRRIRGRDVPMVIRGYGPPIMTSYPSARRGVASLRGRSGRGGVRLNQRGWYFTHTLPSVDACKNRNRESVQPGKCSEAPSGFPTPHEEC